MEATGFRYGEKETAAGGQEEVFPRLVVSNIPLSTGKNRSALVMVPGAGNSNSGTNNNFTYTDEIGAVRGRVKDPGTGDQTTGANCTQW